MLNTSVMHGMSAICPTPNPCVETLTPNLIVLGSEAFER